MDKKVKVFTGLELKLVTNEIVEIGCSDYEVEGNRIKLYDSNHDRMPVIFNFDNILYYNELFEERTCGFPLDELCMRSCSYFWSCHDRRS